MVRNYSCGVVLLLAFAQFALAAEELIFSGPQIGETLAPFEIDVLLGGAAGTTADLIGEAKGKPILLIFVHAQTRPAFGLTNVLTRYAASRSNDGLHTGVIFLTDDPTSTEQWVKRVAPNLTPGVIHGISSEGIEGPGTYGLNRNVTLTILVGQDGVVTGNFALVQPSLQVDGPNILSAIVAALGGGDVPSIQELAGARMRSRPEMNPLREANDPQLTSLLRHVINKQATVDEVNSAVEAVEQYVAENKEARDQLGIIAARVVGAGRLQGYGTPAAQDKIRKWAEDYGPETTEQPTAQPTSNER